MFKMRGGEELTENQELTVTINKLAYCAVSVIVGTDKVLYLQKYPPASGTIVPKMDSKSTPAELKSDTVSADEFKAFWNSDQTFQANGKWKGGAWGENNLTLTAAQGEWLSGAFIGDTFQIQLVKKGIIGFKGGKSFVSDQLIIPSSEDQAWTVNVTYKGKTFGAYLTDNIMPQVANDVLFIWENSKNTQYIKLLRRGDGPNIDMKRRIMPGAGEHLEPGKDVKIKESIFRAINEEIGIPEDTLIDTYLLNLGVFDTEGRDPRYWTFCIDHNGEQINFGMERGSKSTGYVIYLKTETDIEPNEIEQKDKEEVENKWWNPLDTVLTDYPDTQWMIKDHQKLIEAAKNAITDFKNSSDKEKEEKKIYKK